ncbi:MAG: hypothetical protein EZS28_009859 [Streblomastix strix]|uniref:Uncharacterized protein n=1 Tax=Streblomastix strix TaxID=222440 RepID=A0A5J4WJC2_9EUKA|nr:MAG: hypothetical protein EZS28_009859 [Streblomastix strix]
MVIKSGILQLKLPAANFETGISKKIPQCLIALTIDSNDDTLTELFVHKSDNEFAAITAYSQAQINVSQSFVLSLQIIIYLNGPQAVEQPIHSLICSLGLIGYQLGSAPTCIVRGQLSNGSSNALKFILALANAGVVISVAGVVIYQLTQHDYAIERVILPHAPNGALVYLLPSLVSQVTGQSKNSYVPRLKVYR